MVSPAQEREPGAHAWVLPSPGTKCSGCGLGPQLSLPGRQQRSPTASLCLLWLVFWPPTWLLMCRREYSPGHLPCWSLPHQKQLQPLLSAHGFICPWALPRDWAMCWTSVVSFPHTGADVPIFSSRWGLRSYLGSFLQLKQIRLCLCFGLRRCSSPGDTDDLAFFPPTPLAAATSVGHSVLALVGLSPSTPKGILRSRVDGTGGLVFLQDLRSVMAFTR